MQAFGRGIYDCEANGFARRCAFSEVCGETDYDDDIGPCHFVFDMSTKMALHVCLI